MSGFKMDDYVDVAERIREFSAKYPEGSLQSELQMIVEPQSGWLCTAYAYRTPDDPKPGIGHAFEIVPGKTPYTKDSEAMNAETSAWGRAIVALGFDTKKVASAQEVRARQTEERPADPHGRAESRADHVPSNGDPGSVTLTFGKHSGKAIRDVPEAYLSWWIGQEPPKTDDLKRQRAAVEVFLTGADDFPPVADSDIPFLWIDAYGREPGIWRDPWRRG
jgi:hypothetical protein